MFPVQNGSQPTKHYLLWEKVAPMPLLTYFFLGWVGLGVGEFVGFIIRFLCFSTKHILVNRKHPDHRVTTAGLPTAEQRPMGTEHRVSMTGSRPQGYRPQGCRPQGCRPQGCRPQGTDRSDRRVPTAGGRASSSAALRNFYCYTRRDGQRRWACP